MTGGRVPFSVSINSFVEYLGDEWGDEELSNKQVLPALAYFATVTQVEFLRATKMIRFIRKHGISKIRSVSIEATKIRLLEQDLKILDHYEREKSNDPKVIGTVTAALREKGRSAIVRELNVAKKKMTKTNLAIYKTLKEFST